MKNHFFKIEIGFIADSYKFPLQKSPPSLFSKLGIGLWNLPSQWRACLHKGSLVHSPNPAVHVLLGICTEVVRPHPWMLCLRANNRILIINICPHPCMDSLSEKETETKHKEINIGQHCCFLSRMFIATFPDIFKISKTFSILWLKLG